MKAGLADVVRKLREYGNPAIDYKIAKYLEGGKRSDAEDERLRLGIKACPQAKALLSRIDRSGRVSGDFYAKWSGVHWILTELAEIDYPAGDRAVAGLVDQAGEWLADYRAGWKTVRGRVRTHPCALGNAVYYESKLGYADSRTDDLVAMIMESRWPDGGWNCDPEPEAAISSIVTTRLVLRGLGEYNESRRDSTIAKVIGEAARLITERKVFLSRKTGRVIHERMRKLTFPSYYHYDALSALRTLMDLRIENDGSLDPALDSIESKELATGGFPAEWKRYVVSDEGVRGSSPTGWGSCGKSMNEFVTVEALAVLRHYGRI